MSRKKMSCRYDGNSVVLWASRRNGRAATALRIIALILAAGILCAAASAADLAGEPNDPAVREVLLLLGNQGATGRAPIIAAFERFAKRNPGNPDNVFLHYRAALLYCFYANPATNETPDYAKAVAVFEEMFEKYDNTRPVIIDAKLRCSNLLRNRKPFPDLNRAEELCREVERDAPALEDKFLGDCFLLVAANRTGAIAAVRGNTSEARKYYEKVLDYRDPAASESSYYVTIYHERTSSAIDLIHLGSKIADPQGRLAYFKEIELRLPLQNDWVRRFFDDARRDAIEMSKLSKEELEARRPPDPEAALIEEVIAELNLAELNLSEEAATVEVPAARREEEPEANPPAPEALVSDPPERPISTQLLVVAAACVTAAIALLLFWIKARRHRNAP